MHISVNKYDFQSVMGIRIRFSLTILSKIFRMEGEEFGMDRTAKHRGDPRTQRPLRRVRDGVPRPPKDFTETGGFPHKAATHFSHI